MIENARLEALSDTVNPITRKKAEKFFESESFEIYYNALLNFGYRIPPFTIAKRHILKSIKDGVRYSFSGGGLRPLDDALGILTASPATKPHSQGIESVDTFPS